MSHYDYIVIGAGIEGSWTALKLIQNFPKTKVLMLDQFKLPHTKGSSHGETRIIRHAYSEMCYINMMPKSYEDWKQLEKDVGEKIFVTNKPLLLYTDESGYEALDKTITCLRKIFPDDDGINFRELSATQLTLEFPQVKFTEKHRGCLDLTAGLLLADKCLIAVQKRFVGLGGEIMDCTPVTSLVPGSCVKVNTKVKGQLTADKVAVCAGPWTEKLLQPLINTKLPLKTLRIPVHYWRIKDSGPGFMKTSFKDLSGDMSTEFWGIPEYEYPGLVKMSKSSEDVIDPDDKDKVEIKDISYNEISNYIVQHFPGLDASKPEKTLTCLYSMTPNEKCIIDQVPHHPNIAFACGFSGSGFKKAPVVGRMVCQIFGVAENFDIAPFALARFNK